MSLFELLNYTWSQEVKFKFVLFNDAWYQHGHSASHTSKLASRVIYNQQIHPGNKRLSNIWEIHNIFYQTYRPGRTLINLHDLGQSLTSYMSAERNFFSSYEQQSVHTSSSQVTKFAKYPSNNHHSRFHTLWTLWLSMYESELGKKVISMICIRKVTKFFIFVVSKSVSGYILKVSVSATDTLDGYSWRCILLFSPSNLHLYNFSTNNLLTSGKAIFQCIIVNFSWQHKGTRRSQISNKPAHYPHIARI